MALLTEQRWVRRMVPQKAWPRVRRMVPQTEQRWVRWMARQTEQRWVRRTVPQMEQPWVRLMVLKAAAVTAEATVMAEVVRGMVDTQGLPAADLVVVAVMERMAAMMGKAAVERASAAEKMDWAAVVRAREAAEAALRR